MDLYFAYFSSFWSLALIALCPAHGIHCLSRFIEPYTSRVKQCSSWKVKVLNYCAIHIHCLSIIIAQYTSRAKQCSSWKVKVLIYCAIHIHCLSIIIAQYTSRSAYVVCVQLILCMWSVHDISIWHTANCFESIIHAIVFCKLAVFAHE